MLVVRFAKSDENRKRRKEIVFEWKKMLHYSRFGELSNIHTHKKPKNYLFSIIKQMLVVRFAKSYENH